MLAALFLAVPAPAEVPKPADDAPLHVWVDAAIERGVRFVVGQQEEDGSWNYPGHGTGATALALYALLHSAVRDEAVEAAQAAALAWLVEAEPTRTYDTALVLMAIAKADAREHRGWIEELAVQLVDSQTQSGGWGYPGGEDLSNTQYAALGLRAAAHAGVPIPDALWIDLADMVRACGGRAGYGYTRGGGAGARGSMTAAGVGTLAICEAMLRRSGGLDSKAELRFEKDKARGLKWLGAGFSVEKNPGGGVARLYYYLYGLERVGSLTGANRLGPHDWYTLGAESLVDTQRDDGSWSRGGRDRASALVDTAFALLFLRRATRVETGVGSKRPQKAWSTEGEGAGLFVSATGGQQMTLWLSGIERKLAETLEWPGEEREGPRVDQARWFVDGRLVAILPGDEGEPLGLERFPLRHTFEREGEHTVSLVLEVVPPPRKDGRPPLFGFTRRVESPQLVVEVTDVIPAWILAQQSDARRNLVPAAQPTLRASSVLGASRRDTDATHGAARAVDGRARTSWLAAEGDERPTLTVSFPRAVRADTVLVSSAVSVPHRSGWYGRPLEVRVRIDGGPEEVVRMHLDERRKGRLELDEPRMIHKLEVAIPLWAPGVSHPGVPGLAEVELQLSERAEER